MKKVLSILAVLLTISSLTIANPSNEPPKTAEIKIKTSAKCGMCKKRIERDLGVSKGIVNSNLNLDDKVVTITYNTKKTSPEKIKQVISKIGYDADEVIADQKSHDALPSCCQKSSASHKD
ncbi:Heavy metal transport/detoxification protein [Emticicia oligotrophica DSM 17448]|uniref:Heavy metal transport/detoxification protein n=1 Tax=Emticicia oligotrophica (strain DSM 17448 / CIP 109782 / MTCC 6937 / GPTSA100-15) TaxID=929562 RepID=A0ABM5N5Z5_EMTOG|nr:MULTISPECIES: heavy metal-associated domain-containing protein [Emticicia]AFK04866.1 Heavy metal transport/detoxification protein [Emticicia oligotrophica DSM 17448]